MTSEVLARVLLIIGLMLAAGALDALAFTYSASMWNAGRLVWLQTAKSAASFALGIVFYWISVRHLSEAGVVATEIQTLIWFAATIIGVSALSGRFVQWALSDQIAALISLGGLAWLIVRTSSA
jgi:hypothetical protein